MALLSVQQITAAGLTPTLSAVTASDTVAVSNNSTYVHVLNGSGSPINVSISDPGSTPLGNAGTAVAVSVAAGAVKLIPIPLAAVSPATGVATISYSATTTVTAGVIVR